MKKIVVLISGTGSNLLAIIKNAKNYKVTGIYSNQKNAKGLSYGKQFNIPIYIFDKADFASSTEQKKQLYNHIEESGPDLIVLAGFMSIVPEYFIKKYPQKIINTHPSLLPKYPGLHSYEEVLAANDKLHGCTIHYVDAGIDTGEIIEQSECPIAVGETIETLKQKVQAIEHQLYPKIINKICLK